VSIEAPLSATMAPLDDSFGRRHTYLRISLTERCNLRCTYCMPAEGVELKPRTHLLTYEEILRLARLFAGLGVNKIRLTGGEPLIRKDVDALVAELGRIPGIRTLAITTNGLLLDRHLPLLAAGGLNLINISLDTLREDRFRTITRRPGLDQVLGAIDLALAADIGPVKVNCVVMKGVNEDELVDFVSFTRDRAVDVRFIEYMPFGGNGWNDGDFLPYADMLAIIRQAFPDFTPVDLDARETAKLWEVPGFAGRVGFITSMSRNFCGGCNRLRLTADGSLKVCLFGTAELNLRDLMRDGATDPALTEAIRDALSRKKARHAGMHELARGDNRPMILIGG
jgi:cyclic pyranopterin phosphate synthase